MYRDLKKGEEDEVFSQSVFSTFIGVVGKEIDKLIENGALGPCIAGGFALYNISMIDGNKTNVWVEYVGKVIPPGVIDCSISRIIIYDDMPDIVLDRYNEFKAAILKIDNES